MPTAFVKLDCKLYKSFRTAQVSGMFDVKAEDKLHEQFSVEVPDLSEPFQLGAIIGPSGSGKTSLARHAFGNCIYSPGDWPSDAAVIDGFPKSLRTEEIVQTLTAVGFSSPPSWLLPYSVLSNGEKSRADLARALLSSGDAVVFDEYTSVIDRVVARTMSAAVSKSIRSGHIKRKFVAVTCHADVVEWLCPDWIVDMSTKSLARGLLRRRPDINLEIIRVRNAAWHLFAKYHYLDSSLHQSCQSWIGLIEGKPAAFCALLYVMGLRGYWRISRIVVLPDFQGIGVGTRLMEWCAQKKLDEGAVNVRIQGSHPAIVWHCDRHKDRWRLVNQKNAGGRAQSTAYKDHKKEMVTSRGRPIVNFEFIGRPI